MLPFQSVNAWIFLNEADYLALGFEKSKLAFGATFEEGSRQETPAQVFATATKGHYTIVTQWRLNSGNFQQEQDGQVQLYTLCKR